MGKRDQDNSDDNGKEECEDTPLPQGLRTVMENDVEFVVIRQKLMPLYPATKTARSDFQRIKNSIYMAVQQRKIIYLIERTARTYDIVEANVKHKAAFIIAVRKDIFMNKYNGYFEEHSSADPSDFDDVDSEETLKTQVAQLQQQVEQLQLQMKELLALRCVSEALKPEVEKPQVEKPPVIKDVSSRKPRKSKRHDTDSDEKPRLRKPSRKPRKMSSSEEEEKSGTASRARPSSKGVKPVKKTIQALKERAFRAKVNKHIAEIAVLLGSSSD